MHNNHVGYKVRLIHNQIHKIMEGKRRENVGDLTGMQHWTIGFMLEHDDEEIYQRDIETAFSISRATASNMLQVMERKGLVERVPVEYDARLKKLMLTQPARAMEERAQRDIREVEALLLSGFSEKEVQEVKSYLDRMLQNLGVDQAESTTKCCGRPPGMRR